MINKFITTGARASKLSIKQVEELVEAMSFHDPSIGFRVKVCQTTGDVDQKTSLRSLDKTDFFTKELDQWVLNKICRIALHSAKDLPDPMPMGLSIVAITEPLNTEDVVVFSKNIDLNSVEKSLVIATSSKNREKNVIAMWPQAKVVDLRGTIDQRLEQVRNRKVDGVVIAKVALMRLGYRDLNCVTLKGPTTALQGSLAVVARSDDEEMRTLFEAIDWRKGRKILYTGLHASHYKSSGTVHHMPLIKPVRKSFDQLKPITLSLMETTHLLLTSQTAVKFLFQFLQHYSIYRHLLKRIKIICIGKATARALQNHNGYACYIARRETQEGVIELLNKIVFRENDSILYLKSAQSRPKLAQFLSRFSIKSQVFNLYDTTSLTLEESINLNEYDEVVFTSSSTVKSFFENFKAFPDHLKAVCRGPITEKTLTNYLQKKASL